MKEILIVIPGIPKLNIHSGWSGMLKDFYNEISRNNDVKINIYSLKINPFTKRKNFILEKFFKGKIYINYDQINPFELIKRILFNTLIKKIPIQSVIYSPILNKESQFSILLKNSDLIFYFTERVIADIKNIKLDNNNIKKHILFLVDPLSEAFKNHANQENNLIKKYIYKKESRYLKLMEKNLLDEFDINTLVNISDKKYFKKNLNKKIIYHPLKPFLKFKNRLNKNYQKENIYLIGNYLYKPNIIALYNFLEFLSKESLYIGDFFIKNNLKIIIVGFIKKKEKLMIQNILINKKINQFTFIKGSVKNIDSLKEKGLATISFLPTKYGRQTKDFDSINMLMPILRFENSQTNDVSSIYKNKDFFMEFKSAKEFLRHISLIKNFEGTKKMIQNMKDYLKLEKKLFKDFCKRILYKI